jgi:hypothetical protein
MLLSSWIKGGEPNMTIHIFFRGILALAALLAAGFWLRSALIEVPDNIDTIVAELQRVGRWNSMAAGASCATALLGALEVIYETFCG